MLAGYLPEVNNHSIGSMNAPCLSLSHGQGLVAGPVSNCPVLGPCKHHAFPAASQPLSPRPVFDDGVGKYDQGSQKFDVLGLKGHGVILLYVPP